MRYFDVFNGDADGICALHQLRLADPLDSTLVTGLKREIALLATVAASSGDVVTVLDISLDRNRDALQALLDRGAIVHYFDHHFAGDVPKHPSLHALLDHTGVTCTSALVNRYLRGRFAIWAAVGAFGDAFDEAAMECTPASPRRGRVALLRELGASLNYSAYGQTEADVLVRPPTSTAS
jgi:oligoribonuclease NrnB/cAMP/cGMP phosphodiesterase (DHH superfamily)